MNTQTIYTRKDRFATNQLQLTNDLHTNAAPFSLPLLGLLTSGVAIFVLILLTTLLDTLPC